MRTLSLTTIGAVSAVITSVGFLVGIVLVASSGVELLIPETGDEGLKWISDIDESSNLFFVGAWLVVFGGILALVAFVGFYEALRDAGPVMILAPVLGAVGMTLVTLSHAIPVAMAYELVPDYTAADDATKAALAGTADTFAMSSQLMNYVGNALGWGVVVPLYAIAVLKTGVVPRWIGWLGLIVAVFAGWLGLLGPASSVIEGLSAIGFVGFFVFMASMGIALLLRQRTVPAASPP